MQVDGIYDSDPHKNPMAKRYAHLSYRKCVVDDLKVRRPAPAVPPSICFSVTKLSRFRACGWTCEACKLPTTSVCFLCGSAASTTPGCLTWTHSRDSHMKSKFA